MQQNQGTTQTAKVKCEVTNCVYNTEQKYCTAGEIKVGPQFASSTSETICSTFKMQ